MIFVKRGIALAMGLVLSAAVSAQSLSVTPSTELKVGETAHITYQNPSLAGQTVTVTVSGGWPEPTTYEVQITLDARGKGTGTWVAVSWISAHFNAPGVQEVTVPISL